MEINVGDDSKTKFMDLPEDMIIQCLVSVPLDCVTLHWFRGVCKKWRELLLNYDSQIFKERRRLNLQEPWIFLLPSWFGESPPELSSSACVVHESEIFILGGYRGEEVIKDFWIVDPLKRRIKRGPDMLVAHCNFVGAVTDKSLYAIGGQSYCNAQSEVECYDFETKKWKHVCGLPLPTVTQKCYVSFSSSSPTRLTVKGKGYDVDMDGDPVTPYSVRFSYFPSNDTWKTEDFLVPLGTCRWMWRSGMILLSKEYINCKESDDMQNDEAAWKFPSNLSFSKDFAKALVQQTDDDIDPLKCERLIQREIIFSTEVFQTGTACIKGQVIPTNADIQLLPVISRLEKAEIGCEIVVTDALRDGLRFDDLGSSKYKGEFCCLFAVIFF